MLRSTGLTGGKAGLGEILQEHFVNGEWHPTNFFIRIARC